MSVTVRRLGNLNQYSIVLCRTEQGTAAAGSGSRPGEQDYVEYAGQVGGTQQRDSLTMPATKPGAKNRWEVTKTPRRVCSISKVRRVVCCWKREHLRAG